MLSYLVEHQLIVLGVDTAFKSLDGWGEKKKNDSVIVYKLTKLLWRQHFALYHRLFSCNATQLHVLQPGHVVNNEIRSLSRQIMG